MSEVNTEQVRKYTHGKCVGTSDYDPKEEEDEIIILKEINRLEIMETPENDKEEKIAGSVHASKPGGVVKKNYTRSTT